jgi:hypothetical protein
LGARGRGSGWQFFQSIIPTGAHMETLKTIKFNTFCTTKHAPIRTPEKLRKALHTSTTTGAIIKHSTQPQQNKHILLGEPASTQVCTMVKKLKCF